MFLFPACFIRSFSYDYYTIVSAFWILFWANQPCALPMFCIFILLLQLYLCFLLPPLPKTMESPPSHWLSYSVLTSCHPCSSFCFLYIALIAVTFFGTSSHYLYGPFTYLNQFSDHFCISYHYIYTLIPLFTARDRDGLPSPRTLVFTVVLVVWLFKPYRQYSHINVCYVCMWKTGQEHCDLCSWVFTDQNCYKTGKYIFKTIVTK